MQKLSLEEVTSLLGISETSILNHIKKARLNSSTIKNKGATIHVFDFSDIKDFASEFLDMKVSEPESSNTIFIDDIDEIPKKTSTRKSSRKKKVTSVDNESSILENVINDLKGDYNNIIKEFTEYKEQAAFQIGSLKNQVENNQKLLSSGRKEVEEKEMMIRKLKMKLKETQGNLAEEKKVLDEMSLLERIFKIKRRG